MSYFNILSYPELVKYVELQVLSIFLLSINLHLHFVIRDLGGPLRIYFSIIIILKDTELYF